MYKAISFKSGYAVAKEKHDDIIIVKTGLSKTEAEYMARRMNQK